MLSPLFVMKGFENMKLKAVDILNKFEAFSKLADKEIDLSSACVIAKNIKELAIYKDEFDKKRDKLIIEYAEKDEDGNIVQHDGDGIKIIDVDAFNKEFAEILNTDIEVDIIKLNKDSLSEIKVSAKDILPLTDILE